MLAAAVLALCETTESVFSPRNACRVRMSGNRYRNDPYNAKVLPPMSPARSSNSSSPKQSAPVSPSTPSTVSARVEAAMVSPMVLSAANMAAAELQSAKLAMSSSTASSTTTTVTTTSGPKFAMILFKHESCLYKAPFRISVGEFVAVEADRGENIGTVLEIVSEAPSYDVPNRITRRATTAEIVAFHELREREEETTVSVQRTAESIGLGIKVVDTEFQTDMNKLTIYFSSRTPIDFRKLQRSLFRDYRCRIWLVNWAEVEFRKRQADRCLAVPICSKLGSRLNATKEPRAASSGPTIVVAKGATASAAPRRSAKN